MVQQYRDAAGHPPSAAITHAGSLHITPGSALWTGDNWASSGSFSMIPVDLVRPPPPRARARVRCMRARLPRTSLETHSDSPKEPDTHA